MPSTAGVWHAQGNSGSGPSGAVACGLRKAEEPLIAELKGRWAPPVTSKAMDKPSVGGVSQQVLTPQKPDGTYCKIMHMTFSRQRIALNLLGIGLTVFHITDMKREGSRLILTGSPDGDKDPRAQGKL